MGKFYRGGGGHEGGERALSRGIPAAPCSGPHDGGQHLPTMCACECGRAAGATIQHAGAMTVDNMPVALRRCDAWSK